MYKDYNEQIGVLERAKDLTPLDLFKKAFFGDLGGVNKIIQAWKFISSRLYWLLDGIWKTV